MSLAKERAAHLNESQGDFCRPNCFPECPEDVDAFFIRPCKNAGS